jgi:hypothetical protein
MRPYKIIFFLFLIISFCSCQKVIHPDLGTSTSQYVVVGNVTDQPGPYTVTISKSVNFDQDNTFPPVSGAKVYITDSTLNLTDTLTEVNPGSYQTHTLAGVVGHTYHLTILSGTDSFFSSSTIPQPVNIDSVYIQTSIFGNDTDVVPLYKDPVGVGNYYHFVLTIQDSVSQDIYLHSDEITDGGLVSEPLRNDIDVNAGDTITVELQCVDYGAYQYYNNLQQTEGQNSATPANPQSNITGGALGYFRAHTVRRKSIIVQ